MNRPVDVTISMPTRNGGEIFARTLAAVAGQMTGKTVECIALDSGSTDGTLERLDAHGVRVIQVDRRDFDWGAARNRLLQEAQGEIVVQLSQDAIPADETWLERLVAPFSDPGVAVVCGSSIPDPQRNTGQFAWERNGYFYFTAEMKAFREKFGRGLSFANAAIRRTAWQDVGMEPQATGEDFQFQQRLRGTAWRIVFVSDAPVLHHHNYRLRALFRRCRNEGLALRMMGCGYTEVDCLADLISPAKYVQWLRELRHGRLRSPAEWCFPILRPIAVYAGSRFGRRYVWY